MDWVADVVRWYGLLALLTWGCAPLVGLMLAKLPGRGAAFVRPLAVLAVVYPSWLLASLGLAPYATAGLWLTLAVGAAVGWAVAWRRGTVDAAWLRALALAEAGALVAFAAYVGVRGFAPHILNTEKPMDVAFLAAGARAVAMPPADPWFAGEPINYYYLGYLLHGALARMAEVPVAVAYNLALATVFSMCVVAAFGVGAAIVGPCGGRWSAAAAGALAAFFVAVAGNLVAPLALLADPGQTFAANWWQGIGWRSSRVVVDADLPVNEAAITEFPSFSVLLGDLHPHLMALPVLLTTLGLAVALLRDPLMGDRLSPAGLVRTALIGTVAGSLYALNSWDYPTVLLVTVAALGTGLRRCRPRWRWPALGALVAGSLVAWLPFWLGFDPPIGQGGGAAGTADLPVLGRFARIVGAVTWERTSVGEFLTMFGIPYAVVLAFLAYRLWSEREQVAVVVSPLGALVAGASLIGAALLIPAPLVVLCGVPAIGAVVLLRHNREAGPAFVATALAGLGLGIVLATEFFYLRDVFGNRMNTIFKAYYQAWVVLAVAAAVALVLLWRAAAARSAGRAAVAIGAALAVLAGSVYPVVGTVAWVNGQGPLVGGPRQWLGMDGMAYVGRSSTDELAALRWLAANARPDDVVLEAAGCPYQPIGRVPTSRVSAFTGVPTVLGWDGHERQWRNGQPERMAELPAREAAIPAIYADPSDPAVERYGIALLYVGPYERDGVGPDCPAAGPYPAVGEPNFPGPGWEAVFRQGEVSIFRRLE